MLYVPGSLNWRTRTVVIFNEACLNNYANLKSARIKSSDQSFHDYYRGFVTPSITDFWIDSSLGYFFVIYLEIATNQCRTLKKNLH